MQQMAGFPYFEVQFAKDGTPDDPAQAEVLLAFLRDGQTTDLLAMAHGWNDDAADARNFYGRLFARVRAQLDANTVAGLTGRQFAVLGIFWPSTKFTDYGLLPAPTNAASAAAIVGDRIVAQELDRLKGAFASRRADAAIERAKALVPDLAGSSDAREQFVELLRDPLPRRPGTAKDADASRAFLTLGGDRMLQLLSMPAPGVASAVQAVAVPFLSGIEGAALKLINYTTYYLMKSRSAAVGGVGVNPMLRQVRALQPACRLHLIGHSFGARLMTAAVTGRSGRPPVAADTLTLLQAAFSHFGFASRFDGRNDGFFRRMITDRDVRGPGLITHSIRDEAVGIAYPIASLLAFDPSSVAEDVLAFFGALGHDGAQKTPEADDGDLLDVGGTYSLQAGKLHNLRGDAIILDHGDVCKDQIAYALLTAIGAS